MVCISKVLFSYLAGCIFRVLSFVFLQFLGPTFDGEGVKMRKRGRRESRLRWWAVNNTKENEKEANNTKEREAWMTENLQQSHSWLGPTSPGKSWKSQINERWITFTLTSLWCSVDHPESAGPPTWNPRICKRTFNIKKYALSSSLLHPGFSLYPFNGFLNPGICGMKIMTQTCGHLKDICRIGFSFELLINFNLCAIQCLLQWTVYYDINYGRRRVGIES